jgi:MFS family permease
MKAPDEAGTSKTVVLVAVTISSFLAPMALSSVNVALPTMAKELAMDALSLSWVATAYMAAAAMFPAHYPLLMKSVRVAFLILGFMCVAPIYASFARGSVRLNKKSSVTL